jgi:hypothetical protein
MEERCDERPFVVVEYNNKKLTFSVTASLTFGMLKEDCCLAWDLSSAKSLMIDPKSERIWPRSSKVLEAATCSTEQLRVAIIV